MCMYEVCKVCGVCSGVGGGGKGEVCWMSFRDHVPFTHRAQGRARGRGRGRRKVKEGFDLESCRPSC